MTPFTVPLTVRLPVIVWSAVKLFDVRVETNALLSMPSSVTASTLVSPEPSPVKLPEILFDALDNVRAFEYVPLSCVAPTEPLIWLKE